MKTSIGMYHKCSEINLVYFVLAEFYPKKAMSQPLCFDIGYWRSWCYRPFLSKTITVKENAKHLHYITITFLIMNKIIFCLNFFQTHHPSVISTIHMFISINQTLSNYYFKFTPWWYFKISISLKEQKKAKASSFHTAHRVGAQNP